MTSPSGVARQPNFKRRLRRSGKYTPPRGVSCADLPWQTCRHKKFTRPCQWRVPKWLDPRNITKGAESQLNRKSAAFTPRQHKCLVNVRAPQPSRTSPTTLVAEMRSTGSSFTSDNALSGSLTIVLGSEVISDLRFRTAWTRRGCCRRQIRVRLSYHGN